MWVIINSEDDITGPFATRTHAQEWIAEHGSQLNSEPDVVRVYRPTTDDYDYSLTLTALSIRDD